MSSLSNTNECQKEDETLALINGLALINELALINPEPPSVSLKEEDDDKGSDLNKNIGVIEKDDEERADIVISPFEERLLENSSAGSLDCAFALSNDEISFLHHPSFFKKTRARRRRRGRDFYDNNDEENQTRQSPMNLIYELSEKLALVSAEVIELRSEIADVSVEAKYAAAVAADLEDRVNTFEEDMKESILLPRSNPVYRNGMTAAHPVPPNTTDCGEIMSQVYNDSSGREDGEEDGLSGLSTDSYSLMMTKQVCSKAWLFASVVFGGQMTLLGLIFLNDVSLSINSSFLDAPYTVSGSARAAQCIAMMISICTTDDVIIALKDILVLRLQNKEEWSKVVATILRKKTLESNMPRVGGDSNDIFLNRYHMLDIGISSTDRKIWFLHILLPNLLKLCVGAAVMLVTFVIIIQSENIIELFKDFAAMAIIAELDNVAFNLANHGYFGPALKVDADQVQKVKFEDKSLKKCCNIPLRPTILLSLFAAMIGMYMFVVSGQLSGEYFYQKHRNCDIPKDLIPYYGNGECDGGILNRFQCNFDGGDCEMYNIAFPLCNAAVPSKISNGECDPEYDKEECGFDGGDCCHGEDEYLKTDGLCHGGLYNTLACAYDNGACHDFRVRHPNCVDRHSDFRDEDGVPIVLGDGKCSFIKEYMSEECGYEDNDCLQCKNLAKDVSLLGNGICNHENNIPECQYDFGDCLECNERGDCYKVGFPNCELDKPEFLRDGLCHGGDYNTKECGYDGGDCIDFNNNYPECDTKIVDPNQIGDGLCQGGDYNTKECGYDGGDCIQFNSDYPKCDTQIVDPHKVGDSLCQGGEYNTEECGYDGGDCIQFNQDNPECTSEEIVPYKVGDGFCDGFPQNVKECGWDGGDCTERNDNIEKKYDQCNSLNETDVGFLGDSRCHKEFNNPECGYDDGDCTVFNKIYHDCTIPENPWKIGNGECDYWFPEYNSEECGWDGGDCINRNKEMAEKYPDCEEEIRFIGDGFCYAPFNTEECGWDGGDCLGIDYPNCLALSLSAVGDGNCDWDININNQGCGWDGGDCEKLNVEMKSIYPDCPSNVTETKFINHLNNGTCEFETNLEECGWDGSDCEEINELVQSNYSNCTVKYSPLVHNGECNYVTNIEGCGWDGGDCEEENKALESAYPSCTEMQYSAFVGDGNCDVITNIKECGWDGGDCEEENKAFQTKHPNCTEVQYNPLLGDEHCDKNLNSASCGWDGGDCHPDCPVEYIVMLGNGVCEYKANIEGCEWDEGDCKTVNDSLMSRYPNCLHVQYSAFMGDGRCQIDVLNVEACGWEGGDCVLQNKYSRCPEEDLIYLNDNICNYQSNVEACGWDGGDCEDNNKALQKKYPDCDQVQYSPFLGDGVCATKSLNVEACGWDGGDCILQNKYPSCPEYSLSYLDDNVCNYQSNVEACGWDGGDCEASNDSLRWNYPNCTEVQYSLWVGDKKCDHQTNVEACGWDGGDCQKSNKALRSSYPECTEVQYSTWIGDGKCDRQTNVEACGWDGGDCV